MGGVDRWLRVVLIAIAAIGGAGCASGPIPPTYTQAELQAECARHGGWWHADDLIGGFCEHNSQM
jgi:hypothetical protein